METTAESRIESHDKKGPVGPTRPYWAWVIATYFGAGALKPAPGTWGSLGAVLTWWVVAHFWLHTPTQQLWGAFAFAAIATAVGIPAATYVARACGREDPSHVVIDEVAGQMLTLLAAPLHWKALLAGFILFRAFDILKPWPIRKLEALPEGTGIVLDDLGAGVYAWLCLRLMLRAGWLA